MIVEDLKVLPPHRLDEAAHIIHHLKEVSHVERKTALDRAFGCLTEDEALRMEKAIEENCERVDPREW